MDAGNRGLGAAASQLRKYSLPRRHGCLRLCEAIDEAAGVSRDRSEPVHRDTFNQDEINEFVHHMLGKLKTNG